MNGLFLSPTASARSDRAEGTVYYFVIIHPLLAPGTLAKMPLKNLVSKLPNRGTR
jgi:hypothetical protein